jgi:hypothetical protein
MMTWPVYGATYVQFIQACKADAVRRLSEPTKQLPDWYADAACRCAFNEADWLKNSPNTQMVMIEFLATGRQSNPQASAETKNMLMGLAFWPAVLEANSPAGKCLLAAVARHQ